MRILILHDFFSVKGGAEQVALCLLDGLGKVHEVELVTGYINYQLFPDLKHRKDIKSLTSHTNIKGWESLKVIWHFKHRTHFIKNHDVCIFSGIYSIAAALNSKPKRSIYYCHTPPRFVYDLKRYYQQQSTFWQLPLLAGLRIIVRLQYEKSITKMDCILANSKNVQRRLKEFLNINATVVYPPVNTTQYNWIGQSNYYLSTARLESYKRVTTIIKAFMQMPDKKLVVASSGKLLPCLREMAKSHENISFTGWVDSQELRKLIGNCTATIYIPIDEDFGISPVEAMAAGKPTIGVAEGGVQETIIHKKTGYLLQSPPTFDAIEKAIRFLSPKRSLQLKNHCMRRSSKYSSRIFIEKISSLVNKHRVTTNE